MNKDKNDSTEGSSFRQRAEELSKLKSFSRGKRLSDNENLTLIQEREVHQIDLDLRHEELMHSRHSFQGKADKYIELHEFAPSGYFTLSKDGVIVDLNRVGLQMLDNDRTAIINKSFDLFLSQGTKKIFNYFLQRVIVSNTTETCEITLKGKDKLSKHLFLSGIVSENNEKCFVTAVDISDYKLAESYGELTRKILVKLSESKNLKDSLQCILTLLKEGTGFDAVGIRMEAGEDFPFVAQAGFSKKFMQNENTLVEVDRKGKVCRKKNGSACLACACGLVLSNEIDVANRFLSPGGSWWTNESVSFTDVLPENDFGFHPRNLCMDEGYSSIALVPVRNREKIIGLIQFNNLRTKSFTRETIEFLERIASHIGVALMRIKTEEALREKADRYFAILQTAVDGFFIVDLEGNILEVNESYCQMSGFTQEELLKLRVSDLVARGSVAQTALRIKKIIANGSERFESRHRRKDGSYIDVEVNAHYQPEEGGKLVVLLHDITQQKQLESILKSNEEKFRNLVWDMQVGVMIQGPQSEILLCNPKALELLGISEDQLLGKTSFDPTWNVIHEDGTNFPGLFHPVPQAIATRRPVRDVVMGVFRPNSGDRVWIIVHAEPQLNEDGSVRQVVCTFINITKRKKAEYELQESEQRLKFHLQHSPFAIVEWDHEFIVTYWSNEAERMFGWKRDEAIGKYISNLNLIYHEDIPIVNKTMESLMSGETTSIISFNRNITKNGTVIECGWYNTILADQNGKMKSVMSLVQDVTKRKHEEESLKRTNEELEDRVRERTAELVHSNIALKLTEEKYRTVADFTYDWEYWINTAGHYNYMSPSCERITGYTVREFMEDNNLINKIMHPDDLETYLEHLVHRNNSSEPSEMEFRIISKTGQTHWIGHSCRKIFAEGKYLGIRVSNRDITAKVRAEQELVNVSVEVEERIRNHFSRELHDGLGPLLSTIKLFFQWLVETDDAEKIKIISEKGNENIERAIQTTREVAYGLSPLILHNLGYVDAVQNFIQGINETEKIFIDFTFNTIARFGHILEITLYRITTELINNTLKYSKATHAGIVFEFTEGKKLIIFTYYDNGIGFNLEETEKNGKGLGLVNIRHRVKMIMGVMKIETGDGKGTKIHIELPVNDAFN